MHYASPSEEEQGNCITYMSPYLQSKPAEKWIECTTSELRAHQEYTKGDLGCVCHNYISE